MTTPTAIIIDRTQSCQNKLHKHKKIITWVHDHELRGHLLLKKMGKNASRDLLRQPNHKMT